MIKALFVVIAMIFCLSLAPKEALAGVFSFIDKIFASEEELVLPEEGENSQNMPVLEAIRNPDNGKDKLVLSVVGGNAIETFDGPSGTPLEIAEKQNKDLISVYIVREGDTLGTVAEMFGVSVNTIVWANNLTGKYIQPGQKLIILPISGLKYIVKKGDTIKGIASSFGGDADEIMRFNDLTPGAPLVAGTEIIIPDGEFTAPATSSGTKPTVKSTGSLVDANGYYMRPVVGGTRTQGLHGACMCGVDIAGKTGTPIYAVADGTVIVSKNDGGWHGGYAVYVVISHANGSQSLYAHLSANSVTEGQTVKKGDLIGLMGMTGNATGPHLHFEIRGAKNPF